MRKTTITTLAITALALTACTACTGQPDDPQTNTTTEAQGDTDNMSGKTYTTDSTTGATITFDIPTEPTDTTARIDKYLQHAGDTGEHTFVTLHIDNTQGELPLNLNLTGYSGGYEYYFQAAKLYIGDVQAMSTVEDQTIKDEGDELYNDLSAAVSVGEQGEIILVSPYPPETMPDSWDRISINAGAMPLVDAEPAM